MTWRDMVGPAILSAALVAFGWFCRGYVIGECAELVHSDPALCRRLGGVMDADADSTVCVFTCTVPP